MFLGKEEIVFEEKEVIEFLGISVEIVAQIIPLKDRPITSLRALVVLNGQSSFKIL